MNRIIWFHLYIEIMNNGIDIASYMNNNIIKQANYNEHM